MAAGARILPFGIVIVLLTSSLPIHAGATPLPGLGMDMASVARLKEAGAPPTYGSYWVGAWMATSGWGGLENALRTAKAQGVTPVLYWYYWGDSISPSCVENGCSGRTKAQWEGMTRTLADKIRTYMEGAPVIVVLENEFNKGGITDPSYAPTFDAYLEARTATLKGVPGVSVSLGYGSWGEDSWGRFPRALAAADSVGFQIMRASTRDSEAQYRGAAAKIESVLDHARAIANKPAFLYDLALSSYPDVGWRTIQAETLASILERRAHLAERGLVGIVYRELRDNPSMGTHNYYGVAEQYWGFFDTQGLAKPAWNAWLSASQITTTGPAAPNVPGSFEAEAMTATTGGRNAESGASGGATWNVWTDGELRQGLVTESGGVHRVVVVARGTPAQGVDARMEVRLNGTALTAFDVPAGALREYALDVQLPPGESTLAVAFVNDALTQTEDRNLFVDVVRVETPPANRAPLVRLVASASGLTLSADASQSSDPDGDALAYRWDLGDGNASEGPSVSHAYAQPGEYVVTVRVSDGKDAASASATVRAARPNVGPSASFTVAGADLAWTFDASASSDPDGDALTYRWSFGDGTLAEGVRVEKTYAAAGTYEVVLDVADGERSSRATQQVAARLPNRAPSASFTVAGADLAWSFDASASSDPDGDALTYRWDFGDGTSAEGVRAEKTFATGGDRTVTLTVSDGKLSAGAQRVVAARAPNRAPEAAFDVTGSHMTWTFDASASRDADGDALTYRWDFGDGTLAQGARVQKTFGAAGDWTVTLTVADGKAESSATRPVQARMPNQAPTAAFAATGSGLTWTLDASASRDPDGDALTYRWDFGDGTSASGVRVTKTFAAPGDHAVRLQVADGRGLGDETTRIVQARAPAAHRAMEAEAFQHKDNGAAFHDAAASGGRAWLLWTNGAIRQAFAPGGGSFRVDVVAKGDHADGWPVMELRADGALVGRWTVASAQWATYSATVPFKAGESRTLTVHFTNDRHTPFADRNLRVDALRIAPPALGIEAEAFQHKDNGIAFRDATAGAGSAWLLWANGAMRHPVAPGSGAWTVEIVAKGDWAGGWPTMELRLDGATVARWSVSSASWQTYRADVAFAGDTARALSLHFTNDHVGPEGDRNLRIDAVRLVPK